MSEELKRGIPKAVVVGHKEWTEEEKKKNDEETEKWLRSMGKLKDGEHIDDFYRDPVTGILYLDRKKKK